MKHSGGKKTMDKKKTKKTKKTKKMGMYGNGKKK